MRHRSISDGLNEYPSTHVLDALRDARDVMPCRLASPIPTTDIVVAAHSLLEQRLREGRIDFDALPYSDSLDNNVTSAGDMARMLE